MQFLRVDSPTGMARLGSLTASKKLDEIVLVCAHRIKSVSDLASAPALRTLGLVRTKLDEKPFLALKGKLATGAFQLSTTAAGKRLFAELGIPYKTARLIENRFFARP